MEKEICLSIKDFFDFIEYKTNKKIEYEKPFEVPIKIKIQNDHGIWKKVPKITKKRDTIIELKFKNFIMKVGSLHKICVNLISKKCVFAKDLRKGSTLGYINEKLLSKSVLKESDVYDLEIDDENHLYRTTNGVVNHNTEFCSQLAKKTGRSLIKVDMSGIRSKWWGDDEKNVKNIFLRYKRMLRDSPIEPILLLNEADAIIGKRLEVGGTNGAITTSINTVQNILLEEFENFEGILIATTNLTQNFDPAFERRFLYKIEFEKPNKTVQSKIWSNMLKLSQEDSDKLSAEFDLTGGEIENIKRKMISKEVLYDTKRSYETIVNLCKEEKLVQTKKSIGFGQ